MAEPIVETHATARQVGKTAFENVEAKNEVVVGQRFSIDRAWSTDTENSTHLTLFPPYLRDRLPATSEDRRSPLALPYPLRILHRVQLQGDPALRVEPASAELSSQAFGFHFEVTPGDPHRLEYYFETRATRMEPDAFRDHAKAVEDAARYTSFVISQGNALPSAGRKWPPPLIASLAVGWASVCLAIIVLIHRKQPHLSLSDVPWAPEQRGRRGWLALLGLGVTLAPIRFLMGIVPSLNAYSAEGWEALTHPSSSAYDARWEAVLVVELLGNEALLILSVYVAYLFWAGRVSFPIVFVIVQVSGLAFFMVDGVMADGLVSETEQEAPSRVVGYVIGSLVWPLYVLRSRRVRATFGPPPLEVVKEQTPEAAAA